MRQTGRKSKGYKKSNINNCFINPIYQYIQLLTMNYAIQPDKTIRSNSNSKLAARILAKWEKSDDSVSTCGNVRPSFIDGVFRFRFKNEPWDLTQEFYNAISSAFLLYRLVCILPAGWIELRGVEGEETVWNVYLKHKKTGKTLSIYDYKGAASAGSEFDELDEAPESFQKDSLELFNFLISDKCPHPYGITAGCVA